MKKVIQVDAVIFDMDGVITDTMSYHMRAWKIVLARHGVYVTKNDIYKREGQRGIQSVKEIFHDYQKPFQLTEGQKILVEKEELFKKIVKRRFIVGSRLFLKKLKQKQYRLALVTGTARHEVQQILPDSIYQLFDVIICGCEVQNGKPHPEPYLTAIKKLKVPKNKAVVIENAPLGIQSAKSAGLKCFALETSLPKKFLTMADGIFHSFDHLNNHICLQRSN